MDGILLICNGGGQYQVRIPLDSIEENMPIFREEGDKQYLIYRSKGKMLVYKNLCTHQAVSLEGGDHESFVLTCPQHSVSFDLETGDCVDDRGFVGITPLYSVPFSIEDNNLVIHAEH